MANSYMYMLSKFFKNPLRRLELKAVDHRLGDACVNILKAYNKGKITEGHARSLLYNYLYRALPKIINKHSYLLNNFDSDNEGQSYYNILKMSYSLQLAKLQGQLTDQELQLQKNILFNLVDIDTLAKKQRLPPHPNFNNELMIAYEKLYISYQLGRITQQVALAQLNFLFSITQLLPQQKKHIEQHLLLRLQPEKKQRLELESANVNITYILGNPAIFNDPAYTGAIQPVLLHAHYNHSGVPLRNNWYNYFGQPMNNLELVTERKQYGQLYSSTLNPQPVVNTATEKAPTEQPEPTMKLRR